MTTSAIVCAESRKRTAMLSARIAKTFFNPSHQSPTKGDHATAVQIEEEGTE